MSRQELIKLKGRLVSTRASFNIWKRFPESRIGRPDWPQLNNKLPARFDINNLSLVVPDPAGLKFHGNGHHYGQVKKQPIGLFFGLESVDGMTFESDGNTPIPRTNTRYYGHWVYIGKGDVNQTNPNAQGDVKALAGGNPIFSQGLPMP